MTHPHLEGLIRKWRKSADSWRDLKTEYGDGCALTFADCAEELEEAIAAQVVAGLPPLPEPVNVAELDRDDEFRHVKAYTADQMREYAEAALAALPGGGVDAEIAADNARAADAAALAMIGKGYAWSGQHWYLPCATLPTPNPHEADRNG